MRIENWQPIESAPFGESILVYIPNWDHYGPGIYRCIRLGGGSDNERWFTTAWACGRDLKPSVQPTHWMPLPAIPEPEATS